MVPGSTRKGARGGRSEGSVVTGRSKNQTLGGALSRDHRSSPPIHPSRSIPRDTSLRLRQTLAAAIYDPKPHQSRNRLVHFRILGAQSKTLPLRPRRDIFHLPHTDLVLDGRRSRPRQSTGQQPRQRPRSPGRRTLDTKRALHRPRNRPFRLCSMLSRRGRRRRRHRPNRTSSRVAPFQRIRSFPLLSSRRAREDSRDNPGLCTQIPPPLPTGHLRVTAHITTVLDWSSSCVYGIFTGSVIHTPPIRYRAHRHALSPYRHFTLARLGADPVSPRGNRRDRTTCVRITPYACRFLIRNLLSS